jgi:ATP-dependent DNA ligase
VFAHACRLGAEGIVSKKVDGTYRSVPGRVWMKVRDLASVADDVKAIFARSQKQCSIH